MNYDIQKFIVIDLQGCVTGADLISRIYSIIGFPTGLLVLEVVIKDLIAHCQNRKCNKLSLVNMQTLNWVAQSQVNTLCSEFKNKTGIKVKLVGLPRTNKDSATK